MEKKNNEEEKKTYHQCGTSKQLPDPTKINDTELSNSFLNLSISSDADNSFSAMAATTNTACYTSVDLWTSYGKVKVPVYSFGVNSDYIALQNTVTGLDGKPILIKCVDATASNVDMRLKIGNLLAMPSTVIKKSLNDQCGKEVTEMKGKAASNKDMSRQLAVLGATDIHWLTNEYLQFLHTKLQCNNINENKILLSVHNVKDLENAYFNGDNMVYGDGGKMFVDMGKADVIAHELGHGLVKSTANLEYRGHSGALNEHMADVLGVCFEFWLYNKYNQNENKDDNISGGADWLIGEDVGKEIKHLRNMRDPHNAVYPQPSEYMGKYWADPNNTSIDCGGVHINSGVPNRCFFLVAKKIGIFKALNAWFRTLKKLTAHSTFMDFRDALISSTKKEFMDITIESLNTVGLTREAKSDWKV
jgi:Zn-dependent metalloprotease